MSRLLSRSGRRPPKRRASICPICFVFSALLLAACAAPPATSEALPTAALLPTVTPTPTPAPEAPETADPLETAGPPEIAGTHGWRSEGEPRRYDRETLYDLVDGAADLYFSYGFLDVVVEQYVDDAGQAAQVEVYSTATDADAYGLYTYHSYGEPVDLGIDGECDPGYRLAFWQGRAFVQIVAREAVDDAALWALGQAIAGGLPGGGARPALVEALPRDGLQAGSVRFFREKVALDNLLWLGTDDLLGLGPDVEGVVARYEFEGQRGDLLLVSFPDAARAEAARAALDGGDVEGLVIARAGERVLGAVFGPLPVEAAQDLLAKAIGSVSLGIHPSHQGGMDDLYAEHWALKDRPSHSMTVTLGPRLIT